MSILLNAGQMVNVLSTVGLPAYQTGLKVVDDNGSLLKIANVLSPLDAPMTVKVTNTRIADVYNTLAKGAIPVLARSSNTSGTALFVESNLTASDSDSPQIRIPIQARMELKLPNHNGLTEAVVAEVLSTLIAQLVSIHGHLRVTEMMRGVLTGPTS